MLASIVADHLIASFAGGDSIMLSAYHDYQDSQNQQTNKMLAALLKQAVQLNPGVNELMKNMYHELSKGRSPSVDSLFEALVSILQGYSQTFIVLDALDECSDHNSRQKYLQLLMNLRTRCFNVRLFLTSRPGPSIEDIVCEGYIQIRAANDDIARFVDDRLASISGQMQDCEDLWERVKQELIVSADGMYVHTYHLTAIQCI